MTDAPGFNVDWRRMAPDALAAITLFAFLLIWFVMSGAENLVLGSVFAALLISTIAAGGTLALRLVDPTVKLERHFVLTFIVGILSISVIMTVLRFLLPVEPWLVLVGLLVLALIGLRVLPAPGSERSVSRNAYDFAPCLAILISVIATTLWCKVHLPAFTEVNGQTIYGPVNDTFLLTQAILILKGAQLPQFWGNFEFFGDPISFYHYGGFILGGAFASFTDTQVLTTIDGFVTPVGFLMAPLSIYVLATYWWGKNAALASLVIGVLLPDATHYLFSGAWLSYYQFLDISMSLGWGIACITVAIVLLSAATRFRQWSLLAGSVVAGVCVFIFKAQLFVASTPVLIARFLVSDFIGSARTRIILALLTAAAGIAGLLIMEKIPNGPGNNIDLTGGLAYLKYTTKYMLPGELQHFTAAFFSDLSRTMIPFIGVSYLLAASFGVWPIVYAVLLIRRGRRHEITADDLLPLAAIACYIFLALGLSEDPSKPGGYYELQQRPLVWVYAMLAAWCGGALVQWLRESPRWQRNKRWGLACTPLLFIVPLVLAPTTGFYSLSRKFETLYYNVPFAAGYLDSTEYLRRHSEPTDVVQDSSYDFFLYTVGLSERRAYLAKPSTSSFDRNRGSKEVDRYLELSNLEAAGNARELAEATSQLPIRWYLMHPNNHHAWADDPLVKPVFESEGYRVYDFAALPAPEL
jgi:hypothetical protein